MKLLGFGTLWTLFSLAFTVSGLWHAFRQSGYARWAKVPCVIERFDITADLQKTPVFQPDLQFTYAWQGHTYEGRQLFARDQQDRTYSDIANLREEILHDRAKQAYCRVNPANPQEAALKGGNSSLITSGLVFALFGSFFLAIGILILKAGWNLRRADSVTSCIDPYGKGTPIVAVFFLFMLTAGLGLFCGLVLPSLKEYFAMQSWKPTQATVIWSQIRSSSTGRKSSSRPEVFFRYQHNGREYAADRYELIPASTNYLNDAGVIRAHPPGSTVTCFVNPAKPWQAILTTQLGFNGFFLMFPLPFIGIGAFGLRWVWQEWRKEGAKYRASARPLRSGKKPRRTWKR